MLSGTGTWRIIPGRVRKWLGSRPFISHLDRPFGRGTLTYLGDLLTMVIKHFLTGMILQVPTAWSEAPRRHIVATDDVSDIRGAPVAPLQIYQYLCVNSSVYCEYMSVAGCFTNQMQGKRRNTSAMFSQLKVQAGQSSKGQWCFVTTKVVTNLKPQ